MFYLLITLLLSPADDVASKIADLSHFKKNWGLNWITSGFNVVLTQWFNLGLSVSVLKKLLSISPFVTKVPFVALKLLLSNSFSMITCFKSVFIFIFIFFYINFTLYILYYLYLWLVLAFFLVNFHQKMIVFKKTRFKVGETWLQGVSSNFNL